MAAQYELAEENDRINCQSVAPSRPISSLEDDVRQLMLRRPRSLPPKYFYDDHGSRLFDAICDTHEYYPTRTEDALLRKHAGNIVRNVQPEHVVELGSGTSRKTRRLFDACEQHACQATYWPFDVCEEMVLESAEQLAREYGWLNINGLVGDYHGGLTHLPVIHGRSLYVFLGGTIGNFEHDDAVAFLRELRRNMDEDDRLLLGADRVKSHEVLHAAYNDSDGITGQFNLNVLRVLNRELGADFELAKFRHEAFFNSEAGQIEMYLVAECDQQINIRSLDDVLEFTSGERILTEISRKFTPESLVSLLQEADFALEQHFEPDNGYFSLVLARPE
ncbi:MAG: L-histidine N(alpha)-methyltransferase [Granulosicoccaceae bacterium]|jgi:L-histidine N-alpha-methyltransferase